jgi:hypothetical protein
VVSSALSPSKQPQELFDSIKDKLAKLNKQKLSRMYAGAIDSPDVSRSRKPTKTSSVMQSTGDYMMADIYNSI